jgi:transcriptional/translational regulatory protein YebC/TACO1
MTETDQHQQPLQHAIERAKQAILNAQDAEHSLQQAQIRADPQAIQSAHHMLQQAEREVADAQKQLEAHDTESHHQQLTQTLTQLNQAAQDVDAAKNAYTTPRQVR